jgi:hypothetical protein
MVMVFGLERMGTNMRETLRMILLKVMVLNIIRMEKNKRDDGKMASELLLCKAEAVIEENGSMIKKREKVFMTFLCIFILLNS